MSNGWTGATIIEGGVLQVGGLAAINTNSSIGKGSAADPVIAGGTLRYAGTGGATTTNRLFTIGNANGLTATLDSSSATTANTISFTGTGALGMGGSGTRTLTLTGTNIGDNTLASIIGDGSGGTTSVNKTGIGKWVLSGANTYTGTTTVDSGILQLNRATADSSAIPTDGVLGTSGDIVINGGTLQILQSEQIGIRDRSRSLRAPSTLAPPPARPRRSAPSPRELIRLSAPETPSPGPVARTPSTTAATCRTRTS